MVPKLRFGFPELLAANAAEGTDRSRPSEASGPPLNSGTHWRSFVLYALFFALLVTGWHELPDGGSILPWYVIVASAAACVHRKILALTSSGRRATVGW